MSILAWVHRAFDEDVGQVYYSRDTSTICLIEQGKKFLKHFHTITNFPTSTAVAHRVSAERLVSLTVMIEKGLPRPSGQAVMFNELNIFFVYVNLKCDTIREHDAVVCATGAHTPAYTRHKAGLQSRPR